jgi:hypothetical protein
MSAVAGSISACAADAKAAISTVKKPLSRYREIRLIILAVFLLLLV